MDSLKRDGYSLLRTRLTEQQIELLTHLIRQECKSPSDGIEVSYYEDAREVRKVGRLHRLTVFKSLVEELCKGIYSDPDTQWEIHRCTCFRKPAYCTTELGWHQDSAITWESSSQDCYVLWIPLCNSTTDNGTLRVAVGSHQGGRIGHGNHLNEGELQELLKNHKTKELEVRPGECVVMSEYLVHGSGPNTSSRERLAINAIVSPVKR